MRKKNNLTIIVGHYGSGKTEFAVNYALKLQEWGEMPVVADLDIVNPYFRIREQKPFFGEKGIEVISSNAAEDYHLDMPALAASLQSCFQSPTQISIVDVGGDPAGANVLARYARMLAGREYDMWLVVNANRPQTPTAEAAEKYLADIARVSKLRINGIINNTHMLRDTAKEDILRGDALARQLAERTGIPVIYTVVAAELLPEMSGQELAGELFPIKLMRPLWL